MSARKTFRALLEARSFFIIPGAYDGLSARIIEEQGFQAIVAGGYAAAGSLLGQPDTGQSNMRDFADHYGRICDAVSIPVYADGDSGFGGVNNVRQTVRAFERAGVAAMFFTDQVYPSRCGYLPGKQVVPVEHMLAKVKAALDARMDESMMICARTDVAAIEGVDAAIERCQLFMDAGVDMAKPQGIDRLDEVKRVLREVPGPHISTLSQAAGSNHPTAAALGEIGVSAATLPSLALFAAAQAVREVLRKVKQQGSLDGLESQLIPLKDYYDVVRLPEQLERERSFDEAGANIAGRRTRKN